MNFTEQIETEDLRKISVKSKNNRETELKK